MAKGKKKVTKNRWDVLRELVETYQETARADEMKGGGDPADMEIIEIEFRLAQLRLYNYIQYLEDNE